ncbi:MULTISPECIES: hypothetical protein [Vibrio]|uniref:hypothetical protein n=1 Tax=Vibrio TaxID=662 RepID=UPI00037BFFE0|nr:hypothetical protein [Vibrio splendidus]
MMKKLILLLSCFSFSVASNNNTEFVITPLVPTELTSPKVSESEDLGHICKSVVCTSPSKEQTIPPVGDVPPREGNITLNAISGLAYILSSGNG